MATIDRLKLVDGVDFGSHGDVGDFFKNHFDHHWHAEFPRHNLRFFQRRPDFFGISHAHRFAAQPLNNGLMVNTISLEGLVIDVLVVKGELHTEIHIEIALRLANQTEVAVVDQDLHERQTELRASGQLFNEELKVIVTSQTHHGAGGVTTPKAAGNVQPKGPA